MAPLTRLPCTRARRDADQWWGRAPPVIATSSTVVAAATPPVIVTSSTVAAAASAAMRSATMAAVNSGDYAMVEQLCKKLQALTVAPKAVEQSSLEYIVNVGTETAFNTNALRVHMRAWATAAFGAKDGRYSSLSREAEAVVAAQPPEQQADFERKLWAVRLDNFDGGTLGESSYSDNTWGGTGALVVGARWWQWRLRKDCQPTAGAAGRRDSGDNCTDAQQETSRPQQCSSAVCRPECPRPRHHIRRSGRRPKAPPPGSAVAAAPVKGNTRRLSTLCPESADHVRTMPRVKASRGACLRVRRPRRLRLGRGAAVSGVDSTACVRACGDTWAARRGLGRVRVCVCGDDGDDDDCKYSDVGCLAWVLLLLLFWWWCTTTTTHDASADAAGHALDTASLCLVLLNKLIVSIVLSLLPLLPTRTGHWPQT